MDPIDEEKTSFITDRGTYCYKVMPFGLKNVGATYQRLVTKIFQEHLGKTMEVYIDDMLVKSQQVGDHIQHLFDTFQILRKFNMKLNPEKCAFGVSSELSEYDITYQPRTAIKSQVLADFVADFSQGIQIEAEKELQVFNGSNAGTWTLFTDGPSNVKGAGLGIILVPPTGETIRKAIKCNPITNNEAEYGAMIAGLELARELGIEQVVIKSDSQLVVNLMLGTYTTREARMQQYLEKARDLVRQFQTWKVVEIPREKNVKADALVNLASAVEVTNDENAYVIHLFHSVLDQDKNEVNFNNLTWDWRNEIVTFLQYGILPEDKKKAQALRKKADRYCLKQDNLYRKMFSGPLA
ncbi:uncharacterized protein [Nicotiana sylvestris]|uniref:uncharacterized protein n=1 Tax=Nicotiana sylvestris TaxID=4096 RepID=UPI00388C89A6